MTWFILALVCTMGWGCADLFYKISTDENDKNSQYKISVWVGLVMGAASLCMMPFAESGISPASLLQNAVKYSPASLGYILSMIIGYAGLRYLEVSIVSPLQNASGALSAICMLAYFVITGTVKSFTSEFSPLDIASTAIIVAGVIGLAIAEQRLSDREKRLAPDEKKYRFGAMALIFPFLYCVFDTVGTAADGIILNEETGLGLGEIDVLIIYGLTFMLAGIISWIIIFVKEKKLYNPFAKKELTKGVAAICEEFGQIFYVYAMAAEPVLAAPMIASYCIVSVILSAIFIKEKLKISQYLCIIAVILGIVGLGISEGIGEKEAEYVPLSAEEVCEQLELHSYISEDVTADVSEEWDTDKIVKAIASEQGAICFDYFQMESSEDAVLLYNDYMKLVEEQSETSGETESEEGYNLCTAELDGIHTVLVRIDNTFIYASCNSIFGEKVDNLLAEMGYLK